MHFPLLSQEEETHSAEAPAHLASIVSVFGVKCFAVLLLSPLKSEFMVVHHVLQLQQIETRLKNTQNAALMHRLAYLWPRTKPMMPT